MASPKDDSVNGHAQEGAVLAHNELRARVVGRSGVGRGVSLHAAMSVPVSVVVLEERMHRLAPVVVSVTQAVDWHGCRKPAQEYQAGEQPQSPKPRGHWC